MGSEGQLDRADLLKPDVNKRSPLSGGVKVHTNTLECLIMDKACGI